MWIKRLFTKKEKDCCCEVYSPIGKEMYVGHSQRDVEEKKYPRIVEAKVDGKYLANELFAEGRMYLNFYNYGVEIDAYKDEIERKIKRKEEEIERLKKELNEDK